MVAIELWLFKFPFLLNTLLNRLFLHVGLKLKFQSLLLSFDTAADQEKKKENHLKAHFSTL